VKRLSIGMGSVAPFDAAQWDVYSAIVGACGLGLRGAAGFGNPPALGAAGKAFVLFVPSLWRRVAHAEDLIHRLTSVGVAVGEPALAVLWAAVAVTPPIDTLTRMLTQVNLFLRLIHRSILSAQSVRAVCVGLALFSAR
jgi:hypothetical protein